MHVVGMVMSRTFWWIALALVLATGRGVGSAGAQSDGTLVEDKRDALPAFAIAPSGEMEGAYFAVTLDPGEATTLTAALANASEATLRARTFAADAYTAVNGGLGVKEDGSEATGVTTWVDYKAETLSIEPSSTIERRFSVTVPSDAAPGQYITGLVLQTADPLPIPGSTMFDQILRKTVAVFITVPGPTKPGLAIGDVSLAPGDGWHALTVEVANTGNVLVRPEGTLVVRDRSEATILTAPVAMGPIYAGHNTTLEIVIGDPLPAGDLAVDVELVDAARDLAVSAGGTVTAQGNGDGEPQALVVLDGVTIAAVPSPDAIQYVDVAVRIANGGAPVGNARLVLHVHRDDALVEDFLLASSLALPAGTTDVAQRYVPSGGWTTGSYRFGLTLETVDPASGAALVIADVRVDGAVMVP